MPSTLFRVSDVGDPGWRDPPTLGGDPPYETMTPGMLPGADLTPRAVVEEEKGNTVNSLKGEEGYKSN